MELTYKDVLTCKTWIGDIHKMCAFAIQLGYPYFLWNGWVYSVDADTVRPVETGKTVDDIR